MFRVEFTIEPFADGVPGPHVTAPADALRALGVAVDVGPFGSACSVPAADLDVAVGAVVREAFANGATHVNVDVDLETGASHG